MLIQLSGEHFLPMNGAGAVFSSGKDVLCVGYRTWRSMHNKQKLVRLQVYFVLEHAVLGDANTQETRPNCAHSSNYG